MSSSWLGEEIQLIKPHSPLHQMRCLNRLRIHNNPALFAHKLMQINRLLGVFWIRGRRLFWNTVAVQLPVNSNSCLTGVQTSVKRVFVLQMRPSSFSRQKAQDVSERYSPSNFPALCRGCVVKHIWIAANHTGLFAQAGGGHTGTQKSELCRKAN